MKVRNWAISDYVIAFLDISGQKDKILSIDRLRSEQEEQKRVDDSVEDTAGYVVRLRRSFSGYFEKVERPSTVLDKLTPEQRTRALKLRRFDAEVRGVADSIIITIPLDYEEDYHIVMNSIYAALYGICGMFLAALAENKPFRGGVDIGWGVRLPNAEKEVYGSALVKAYSLESNVAYYPRVVIGDTLWNYINKIETISADDLKHKLAKEMASQCREFITVDYDYLHILDVIGKGFKSIEGGLDSDFIERGYRYVVDTYKDRTRAGDVKLSSRYACLRRYLESRLHIWGIQPLLTESK